MDTEIGEAAGRIWQYLMEHGEVTLRQLQRGTTLPERLLHMGVGWLAANTGSVSVIERRIPKITPFTASAATELISVLGVCRLP
jgi:hypothetical protein